MKNWQRLVLPSAMTLVCGAILLFALWQVAHAATTLVVTTAVDENDGSCTDGTCSLRDALALAANGDTITFADNYTITLASQLAISKTVTLEGGGRTVAISGNNATRLFYIQATGVVTLSHLSLVNGTVTGSGGCPTGCGGGIYNGGGMVTVQHSTFSGNQASYGGGIYNNNGGTMLVQNSTLSSNRSNSGGPSSDNYGGGIYNASGTVTVQNSTLSGNVAKYGGGGIYNGGTVRVQNSTLTGNSASNYPGGGIRNSGTLVIQTSLLSNNSASASVGGGIYSNGGTVTVQNSTLSGNSAWNFGGGIYNADSSVTVQNSTLSSNSAQNGGGIHNASGTVTVQNSTFSGNSANYSGGNIAGGLYNEGTATVQNSTFSGNSASNSGGGAAGGLANYGTLHLSNTIIANSSSGSDCAGTLATNDHNLVEDNTCSPFLSGDPALGALADNGGPTWTFLPGGGSPVINAGNNATCLATDQRGYGRADTCDIGSVEVNTLLPEIAVLGNSLVIADGDTTPAIADDTDFGSVLSGLTLTHTFTISNSGQVTLSVSNLSLSGVAAGEFSLGGLSLPALLSPNTSAAFQVYFAPTMTGTRAVTLTVANNAPGRNPYDFALQGVGVFPDMAVLGNGLVIADGDTTPASADDTDFGSAAVAQALTHTFTISNSGQASLSISAFGLSGAAAGDFSVSGLSLPALILTNTTTTFQVRFVPTAGGTRAVTLTIANNDPDVSPYDFALQGTGLAPEIAVLGNGAVIANGDTTPASADGTDFGGVVGEALTHTFTISNSGQVNLYLTGAPFVTFTGPAAAAFSLVVSPTTPIAPGETTSFQVRFAPTAFGVQTATLMLANSVPTKNPYNFALQGTGLPPDIAVLGNGLLITDGDATPATADGTDFGSVAGGLALTHTFTLSNSGSGNLYLTGAPLVAFTGPAAADFSLVVSPTTPITPGGMTTFQVRFAPTALGTRAVTLTISNNDPDENPYDFALQGTAPCWLAVTVQNTNDSGAGSLRQALAEVCNDGTIDFAAGLAGQTLALTSAELSITKTVTIANPRAPGLSLSGNNAHRLFNIQATGVVTLSQLRLSNGKVTGGFGCPTYCGGGIYNAGGLTLLESTLSGNAASFWGGGIYNAGALTVRNSTFSGNSGGYSGGGGGIYNDGTLTVLNSTFSGNLAGTGGGLLNPVGSTLSLVNTVLANSTLGGDCRNDGQLVANSHNLVQDGGCSAAFSGDPLLGPLADNGGATWTHALLFGSPAADAGDSAACPATDQRGFSRPGGLTSFCDIGAFERQGVQPDASLALTVTPATAYPGGVVAYRLAFSNVGDGAATGLVITVTLPVSVTNLSVSNSGAGIILQTGTHYVWDVADLIPGAGGVITITGVLSPSLTPGVLDATAIIAAPVYDRDLNNNTGTAGLLVQAANAAPLAVNDVYTTPQDTALTALTPAQGVLGNDSDADNDPLFAALITPPTHGTLALVSSGEFVYMPAAGFSGADGFTYTASDGALTATGRVTITVTYVNHPVIARDDIAVTREDEVLGVPAPGVLGNDADPDGDPLTAELLTAPLTGTVTLTADGAYTYTPPLNFNDVVTFTYRVRDAGSLSATATVYILVQAVNDAPTFIKGANQTVNAGAGAQTVANWATAISPGPANESWQTLTFILSNTDPALFAVQPTVDALGTLRYTPAANVNGAATVTVTLKDNGGTAHGGVDISAPQSFVITIQPEYRVYLPVVVKIQ